MKKQKSEPDWNVLGKFIAKLVTLFTLVRETFGAQGVGLVEALVWVESKGRVTFVTKFLEPLAAEIAKALVPIWRTVISGLNRDALVAGAIAKGRTVGDWARQLIAKTVVTSGVTYHLVVITGEEFATDEERTFANIRALAQSRGYRNPPAEVALLLAQYSQQELGYQYLVVMHDPISVSVGIPDVLVVDRNDDGDGWVDAWFADPALRFDRDDAFVFLAP